MIIYKNYQGSHFNYLGHSSVDCKKIVTVLRESLVKTQILSGNSSKISFIGFTHKWLNFTSFTEKKTFQSKSCKTIIIHMRNM